MISEISGEENHIFTPSNWHCGPVSLWCHVFDMDGDKAGGKLRWVETEPEANFRCHVSAVPGIFLTFLAELVGVWVGALSNRQLPLGSPAQPGCVNCLTVRDMSNMEQKKIKN